MRPRLESALLSVLGWMGVTVSDADPSSAPAVDARDRSTLPDDPMVLELAKAAEAGNTCVIVSLGVSPAACRAPLSNREQGEERCSNSLQSS